jgi:tetratricopeptide (TPR) repeat protein
VNRRDFLSSAAAVAILPKSAPGREVPEITARPAPYLALQPFLEPGSDEFKSEKTALDLVNLLHASVATGHLPLATSICPSSYRPLANDLVEAVFDRTPNDRSWPNWVASHGTIIRAEFQALPDDIVQFGVTSSKNGQLQHTTGRWKCKFINGAIVKLNPLEQLTATAPEPWFRDITESAFKNTTTLRDQLSKGIPYWRSRLDPATGIDLYGSNGISVGDIDNDGMDEVYVCQPGGIPNRLLKFMPDGSLIDISDKWNANMLDDTASALFLDLRNIGRQDLVVLRSGGPVLLLNEHTHFRIRTDAFDFKTPPQGGFTGMAAADYDRDGKLDLYLCCYVYFQSEAQYTYAAPYHDARNGPPNFLLRNNLSEDGTGSFIDVTAKTGMNENNNRFSFAPAWCDFNDDGWPDLYVANDFGRKNFYVNQRGHFQDKASELGVDDIGPGMSAAWFDANHDQHPDIYVANMWTAAGQRVIRDPHFVPTQTPEVRNAYLGHTMGNSLLEQTSDNKFTDVSAHQHVAFGRWAWAAGGHDFDNDGTPEIFVTCGMLTNESLPDKPKPDLGSFFWRQVVNKSPVTAQPSLPYQEGWNALNQFIREDYSWNGNEPNVLHVKRGNRYYDFSGVSGLDYADDSRAFAVLDFDQDGRPDIILKSRLGPQIRLLQNNCTGTNHSIAFRLKGTKSNRDAIGARIDVDGQTRWLAAGSEFLSQHSKTLLFGLGSGTKAKEVTIKWPSGLLQKLPALDAGYTYSIVEGSASIAKEPFRKPASLPSSPIARDNSLALADTWFLEPVPLPEPQKGPGLLALDFANASATQRSQYEIFRRYLFDWRAPLEPQLALLLNEAGHAVKIYAKKPSPDQVATDLKALAQPALDRATPFPGYYVSPRFRDFFKFGAAFLWAGYSAQALPYLEQVLQHTPKNLRTLLLAAQVSEELNLDTKAEDFYQRALAADANSPEANNGLGLALAKRGQPKDAQRLLEHAIELKRDYSDAINNLGVLFTKQGQLNDAIAAFQYGIQVAPEEDILYLNLGRAYIQSGKLDRAREVMQQLLDKKPDSEIARRALKDLAGRN